MANHLLVLCACSDETVAKNMTRAIVHAKLAACVSRLPGVTSTYHWQGNVEENEQVLLLIKTQSACMDLLEAEVKKWHPDEVPELIAVDITHGLPAYLAWMDRTLG